MMKKKNFTILLITLLAISIVFNIVFVVKSCGGFVAGNSFEKVEAKAKKAIKAEICKNLYIPKSYDPAETRVDSLFYNPLLDIDCYQAATTIIDNKKALQTKKHEYEEAQHDLEIFGSSDVFWENRQKRDVAKAEVERLESEITAAEETIKSKEFPQVKKFMGWAVSQSYRAKTNNGDVVFGNVCYCFDEDFKNVIAIYSIDNNDPHNINAISEVIREIRDKAE